MTDTSSVVAQVAPAAAPPTPIGVARTIPVNRPEVDALVTSLGLPPPSALSPLPGLAGAGARGAPRSTAEVMLPLDGLAPGVATWSFTPLSIPDRILELRAAVFNGAPTPCRLHANRSMPGVFAGVRPALAYDYELLAPFSDDDLEVWVRLGLQLSTGQHFPVPATEISGRQLSFLLALADAHKLAMSRAFLLRSADPPVMRLAVSDLLDAQSAALAVRDRRWALCAVDEVLSALIHPGGATGVGLPVLDAAFCRAEVERLARDGYIVDVSRDGEALHFRLGPTLSMFASTLTGWLTTVMLHDVQIVAVENGRPRAQEELLLFIATDATVWTLLSSGLASARDDLSPVQFGLRSMDVMAACTLARELLQPLPDVVLPADLYAPKAVAAPVVVPAAAPASPAAAAPAAPAAPVAAAPAAPTAVAPAARAPVPAKPVAPAAFPAKPVAPAPVATAPAPAKPVAPAPVAPAAPVAARPAVPAPVPAAAAPPAPAPAPVAPAPTPPPWTPTHTVPATGLDAYTAADATVPPVARLDPYLDVQVIERLGAWAHIVCSNGWAAWIDGRPLVERPR